MSGVQPEQSSLQEWWAGEESDVGDITFAPGVSFRHTYFSVSFFNETLDYAYAEKIKFRNTLDSLQKINAEIRAGGPKEYQRRSR